MYPWGVLSLGVDMTTIIGIQYDDKAIVMADNRVTDDSGRVYHHPDMVKAVERGDFIIAGSGEVSPCDIAQHLWTPPKPTAKDKQDIYHFMIAKAMPSLRQCLSDNGYNFDEPHDKAKDGLRFQFLIACCGELFDIDQDLAVMRDSTGFYAVGSGSDFALGALDAGAEPLAAMTIASKRSAFTSGPFLTLEQFK